ncbi:hypothetical protein G7Y89_g2579 [Cudoniella acicularis]|uniref:alpha-1,2-Mannosidase n=1 Tax=Cudoniella acicularis TaxID=354080 RepID=A0A8H4RUA4_9HELO|nr:hypothetical protein G7Y89_g2579 [Cudoniella acicularis]
MTEKNRRSSRAFGQAPVLGSIRARRLRILLLAVLCSAFVLFLIPYHSDRFNLLRNKFEKQPAIQIQCRFGKEDSATEAIRVQRQQKVKEAFVHAWEGYKKHAWLKDELKPISGGFEDPFIGWAATLVNSLDALYILGLQEEFHHALHALGSVDFSRPNAEKVPVSETAIKYLGGLLGAYDISGGEHLILLQKARQLGDFLLLAFDTLNGVPVPYYFWEKSGEQLHGEIGVQIAQIGSLSLEFTRLSQLTGERKYFDAVSRITVYMERAQNSTLIPGLWPTTVDTRGPSFKGTTFTLGTLEDSVYEYLPKEHILLNGETTQYLKMYRKALASATKYHFFVPKVPGNWSLLFPGYLGAYGAEPTLHAEVQHRSCFVGGMVALGSRINDSPLELATAAKLTDGCVWAYQNTASGIMPETFQVDECSKNSIAGACDWKNATATEPGHQYGFTSISDKSYMLRPEAIESVFVMYRITGDPAWQEKGWTMFQAIMNHTTTPIANAWIEDVTSENTTQGDGMESYWLAQTLKYFYLLFSEPDLVSLDDFVLNAEAHPFRLRDRLFT